MEQPDYYAVLGVAQDASTSDIKKRYRKLARQYHPDVSTDPQGEERFKEVNEAWQVLKSDETRAEYDAYRQAARHGSGGPRPGSGAGFEGAANPFDGFTYGRQSAHDGDDYSDFFREVFGDRFRDAAAQAGPDVGWHTPGPHRGKDVRTSLSLPIRQAFEGTKVPITLRTPRVSESGHVEMTDRTLNLTIPPGVTTGRNLRLSGQGDAGFDGGEPGDLYIEITVKDDEDFALDGHNVSAVLDVAPWELTLGATVQVATLGGKVALKIPADSQNGRKLRLRGRGFPGDPAGDHIVILRVIMPPVATPDQKAAWEGLRDAWPEGLAARGGS